MCLKEYVMDHLYFLMNIIKIFLLLNLNLYLLMLLLLHVLLHQITSHLELFQSKN